MNGLEIFRQMHVEAKAAFDLIEQAPPEQRSMFWTELAPQLARHEELEENFLYHPAAQSIGTQESWLMEWEARHHAQALEAQSMISGIEFLDPRGEDWMMQVKHLRTTLEQHIQTEEGEIWPHIEQVWGGEHLDRLGSQLQAAMSAGTRQSEQPAA
jgi:hemerythrin-like domain-containing protein